MDTCFTVLLDLKSATGSEFATFIENVIRNIPPSGCRMRLAAYGSFTVGQPPKILLGRYVSTGEEVRRQWERLAKVPAIGSLGRIGPILDSLFKSNTLEKDAKRVGLLVSSSNWLDNPSFMAALKQTCATGVELQYVSSNNFKGFVSLMRARCNSGTPPPTSGRTPPANNGTMLIKDFVEFNKHIVNALLRFQTEIDVTHFLQPVAKGGCGWPEESFFRRFEAVLWNNPLLFHVGKGGLLKTKSINGHDEIVSAILVIDPSMYKCSAANYGIRRKKVELVAEQALRTTAGVTNMVEKVRRLHDFIVANSKYSLEGRDDTTSMRYRTVYDTLVCGKAVCEGFTVTFRYLLQLIGIESRKLVSTAMCHCWNYVRLGANWYHVDVTFDNPVLIGPPNAVAPPMSHDFFLLSDAALLAKGKHHDWDRRKLPPATDTRFDHIKW